MDQASAAYWLDVLAACALVLWFAGAWFVSRARQAAAAAPFEFEVAASPDKAKTALVLALRESQLASPLRGSVIGRADGGVVEWRSALSPFRHQGAVQLTPLATGGTRAQCSVHGGLGMLTAARIVVFGGLVATAGLYWALREHALPSDAPNVRAQVIQMVQAIHLLWPPFLLAGLGRRLRTMVQAEVERVLKNAAFAE